MSFIADRVYQTAANPGSGAVTPSGSVTGYKTFASSVPSGSVVTIAIESTTPGDWEATDALWNGSTLQRLQLSGSSTGARVTFSSTVNVYLTMSARALTGVRAGSAYMRATKNFGVT